MDASDVDAKRSKFRGHAGMKCAANSSLRADDFSLTSRLSADFSVLPACLSPEIKYMNPSRIWQTWQTFMRSQFV